MRSFLIVLIFCVFILGSCQQKTAQRKTYFDSLVEANTTYLLKKKTKVNKFVAVGNKQDSLFFQPDSTSLANDLEAFKQLAVFQKPAYRDLYKMEDGLTDGQSNLTVRQYSATQPVPVPLIRFYYFQNFDQLKKIEADYQDANSLYATVRHLVMEFEEKEGTPVLSSYSMKGFQKMMLSDSNHYYIQSQVIF